jgi:hypothetical protein
MRFLKTGAGRWLVPAVLAAVLAAALLVTPVIGASSGISGKKVNKTIAKKTNVTQLQISGAKTLGASLSTLGTLKLSQGAWDIRTTFDIRQNAAGANITCYLRLNGVGQDTADSFVGTGTITANQNVAMEVAGQAKAATSAQLLCSSTAAAQVNHAEITALKVPAVKLIKG